MDSVIDTHQPTLPVGAVESTLVENAIEYDDYYLVFFYLVTLTWNKINERFQTFRALKWCRNVKNMAAICRKEVMTC